MNYNGQQVLAIVRKDPDAELPYSIDWNAWLLAGQTVVSSTWVADTGITIMGGANMPTLASPIATVWLSGGTPGTDYIITNHVTTSSTPPLKDDRSFVVRVMNR